MDVKGLKSITAFEDIKNRGDCSWIRVITEVKRLKFIRLDNTFTK